MNRVLAMRYFDDEDRELLDINKLADFYNDEDKSLFQRMKRAFNNSTLHREQQFMAGIGYDELPGFNINGTQTDIQTDDQVLDQKINIDVQYNDDYVIIQGIIDAISATVTRMSLL